MMLRDSTIIFIISFAFILGFAFLYMERKNYNKAPKKIWTFLDNPDKMSKTQKLCIDSWKKHNSDYDIIILTPHNYKGYINIPSEIALRFKDNLPLFLDLLRLWTLVEHGGIWCNSTNLLKTQLDTWLFPKYAEFSGFYIDAFTQIKEAPVIENWFLAANKGSQFMKKWRDEFTQIAQFQKVGDYIESRKKMGVNFQRIPNPEYLASYIAAQKVLQIDKYPRDTFILRKAEDGPLKYLVDTKWNVSKALQVACSDKKYQTHIVVFRDEEQEELNNRIEYDLSIEKCEWV